MSSLPEPPIDISVDVRDLDGFMLNAERLLASELWALSTGEEFKAAVGLWCRAWKQLPAASLPSDDRVLASFAGVSIARWNKVKAISLRGFVECSDGRLYHGVLVEDAKRASVKKAERRERTKAATEARKKQRDDQRNDTRDDTRDDPPNDVVTKSQGQGQGQGQLEEDSDADASGAEAPDHDPVKDLWGRAVKILGPSSRGLIGKARKQYGDIAVIQAIAACEVEAPTDPAGFFVGCLQQGNRNERKHQSGYSVLARAAIEHDERQGNRSHPEAAYRPARDAEELDDIGDIVH